MKNTQTMLITVLVKSSFLVDILASICLKFSENVPGVILLLAVWFFYPLIVAMVQADAAHFNRKTFWVIRNLFGARAYVDYNPRRMGKKSL